MCSHDIPSSEQAEGQNRATAEEEERAQGGKEDAQETKTTELWLRRC